MNIRAGCLAGGPGGLGVNSFPDVKIEANMQIVPIFRFDG
jgi:hypothetical protein